MTVYVGDWVQVKMYTNNMSSRFGRVTKISKSGKAFQVQITELETFEFLPKDILEVRHKPLV